MKLQRGDKIIYRMPGYEQSGVFVKHLGTNSKAGMVQILLDSNKVPCVAPVKHIKRAKV